MTIRDHHQDLPQQYGARKWPAAKRNHFCSWPIASSSLYNEEQVTIHDRASRSRQASQEATPCCRTLSEAIAFVAASNLRLLDPSARFGFATAISADEATAQRFPLTHEFRLIDTELLPEKI